MRNLFSKIVLVGFFLSFFGGICFSQKTATGILFILDFGGVNYYESVQLAMGSLNENYHVEVVGKLEGYREIKRAIKSLEKELVNAILVMPVLLSNYDPFLGSVDYILSTSPVDDQVKRRNDYHKVNTTATMVRTKIFGAYSGIFDSNIDKLIRNLTINPKRPQDYVVIIVANSTLYDNLDDKLEYELVKVSNEIKEKYKFSDVAGYVLPQRPSYRLNSTGAKKLRTEIMGKYSGKKIIFLGYSFEKIRLKQQVKKLITFSTWGGYVKINKNKILAWVNNNLEELKQTEGETENDNGTTNN